MKNTKIWGMKLWEILFYISIMPVLELIIYLLNKYFPL